MRRELAEKNQSKFQNTIEELQAKVLELESELKTRTQEYLEVFSF